MTYTSSILLRSALFIFSCLFHTAVFAEAKVGDHFGDWVFECRAVTADKNPEAAIEASRRAIVLTAMFMGCSCTVVLPDGR